MIRVFGTTDKIPSNLFDRLRLQIMSLLLENSSPNRLVFKPNCEPSSFSREKIIIASLLKPDSEDAILNIKFLADKEAKIVKHGVFVKIVDRTVCFKSAKLLLSLFIRNNVAIVQCTALGVNLWKLDDEIHKTLLPAGMLASSNKVDARQLLIFLKKFEDVFETFNPQNESIDTFVTRVAPKFPKNQMQLLRAAAYTMTLPID